MDDQGDAALELRFHHAGVSVPDLDAAVDWYGRVLGFEKVRTGRLPQVPADIAWMQRGNLRIELFCVPNAKPADPSRRIPDEDLKTLGFKHVSFAVKSLDAAVEELKRRDADIVFVKQTETFAVAFIRDLAGNLIEFYQQPDLWS